MFQRRPALRFVLLFISGILLATWIFIPPIWLFSLTIVLIFLSVILFWMNKWQFVAVASLYSSVVLLGLLFQTLHQLDFQSRELEPKITDEPVTLFGTVDSEPSHQERKISFIMSTDSIIRYGGIERDARRVMVLLRLERGDRFIGEVELGKRLELRGSLEPFPFQRNPGEFDFGKYLALNDIQGVVSVKGLHKVQAGGQIDRDSFKSWTYSVQQALYRIIDSLHAPTHASFLKGIIFGYRAEIPPDVKQSFMDTGTIHILAVSGSNVAFVAFIFYSVFGFFRLPRKAVGVAAILGLIAYMLITGSSASVVRATIMAIVLLCGSMIERKADIYNSISVAVLILLLWNTNTLFDVGFQLSFAAVISIVYFYPRLERLIKKIPERFVKIKAVDVALKLFAVSLAAQLGTIPFTAYYFGRVSLISLLANIPVVPLSGLNTFIGSAEVMLFFISPWIAKLYAATNDFLVWFLLGFVKQAASILFAYIETWHFNAAFIAGYYVVVLSVFNLNMPRIRAWALILILIIGNYVLFENLWTRSHPKLTVTTIDVGQGDASLIEFPNGKHLLVDTGPSSRRFDAGERTIIPFLKRKGISKLDYLLITHPHSDHVGGAGSILKSIQVDTLIMNFFGSCNRQTREVLEIAQIRNVGLKAAYAGSQIQIDSNARVYVLYPNQNQLAEKNANNSSLVLKVLYGNASMLLVGDAEDMVEQRMLARYNAFLASDMLKVGHHGSISSTSEEFLKIIHPQTAIVSVGTHNQFRHPSPFILKRIAMYSIGITRTDKMGAIIWENDGKQWMRRMWRQRW